MDAQSAGDGVPWTGWRRGSCVSRNDHIALRSRWPPRSAVTEARVVHMCPGSCLISNYYLVACRLQPKNLMTHHSRRSAGRSRATSACIGLRRPAVRARYERHDGT